MIKECPKCGANVSPKAQVCPECGEPLAPPTLEKSKIKSKSGNTTASRQRYIPKKNGGCLKTILIVFGVFIVIGVIANLGSKENKPTKNNFDTTNAPVTNEEQISSEFKSALNKAASYPFVAKTHRLAYGMEATFLQLDFDIE